jgi:hypothetical protein
VIGGRMEKEEMRIEIGVKGYARSRRDSETRICDIMNINRKFKNIRRELRCVISNLKRDKLIKRLLLQKGK